MISLYRYLVSPFIHFLAGPACGCRFEPTCSEYASDAVRVHGISRGLWLALSRLLRCHPWGGMGVDPVPQNRYRTGFKI